MSGYGAPSPIYVTPTDDYRQSASVNPMHLFATAQLTAAVPRQDELLVYFMLEFAFKLK
jgi:hypothetical protein